MLNPNLYNNDDKAREGAAIQIQGQLTFTSPDQKITKGGYPVRGQTSSAQCSYR